jgi:hypothetical protein
VRREDLAFLLVALLIPVPACGLLPGGTGDPGEVVVTTPSEGQKLHSLAAATFVRETAEVGEAITGANAGLRIAGERKGIRSRYSVVGPAAEEYLVEALQLRFGDPVAFAAGDELQLRAYGAESDPGRYTAHVIPRGSGGGIDRLEVGIVGRPGDGSLLPVVRASIPVGGSGTYLLLCESGMGETFGALIELEIAGRPRAATTNLQRRHRLLVQSYVLRSDDLSRILRLEDIEERGGPGGMVLEVLPRDRQAALVRMIAEDGRVGPRTDRILGPTSSTILRAGGLNLMVSATWTLRDGIYATKIAVQNRGELPPLEATHGERSFLLLLGWDAESPGRSVAALITLSPAD